MRSLRSRGSDSAYRWNLLSTIASRAFHETVGFLTARGIWYCQPIAERVCSLAVQFGLKVARDLVRRYRLRGLEDVDRVDVCKATNAVLRNTVYG